MDLLQSNYLVLDGHSLQHLQVSGTRSPLGYLLMNLIQMRTLHSSEHLMQVRPALYWHTLKRTPKTSFSKLQDRKSTRLNSSHSQISYAVFCLKKKKIHQDGVRYRRTAGSVRRRQSITDRSAHDD